MVDRSSAPDSTGAVLITGTQIKDGTITAAGLGVAGSVVVVTFPDGSTGSVTVGGDGILSVATAIGAITDTADIESAASNTITVFVDQTAPVVPDAPEVELRGGLSFAPGKVPVAVWWRDAVDAGRALRARRQRPVVCLMRARFFSTASTAAATAAAMSISDVSSTTASFAATSGAVAQPAGSRRRLPAQR